MKVLNRIVVLLEGILNTLEQIAFQNEVKEKQEKFKEYKNSEGLYTRRG